LRTYAGNAARCRWLPSPLRAMMDQVFKRKYSDECRVNKSRLAFSYVYSVAIVPCVLNAFILVLLY
jgi:hypothetical protein